MKLWSVAIVASWATWGAQTAHAQARDPWRVQTSLSIDETYSDNVNLAPAGGERSELVTTVSPSLSITRLGSRLTLTFSYQPQLLYYVRGTNGSTLRNYLNANASATVIENLLVFDASAAVSQQNVSPFGSLAANSVNGSSNRAESRNYSFGPTLRSRYGNDISYTAGYRYTGTSTDSSALTTNHTSAIFGNVQSGTSFRDIGVGANYNRSDQSYGGSNEIIVESLGGNLTYVVSPTTHLRGGFGYDHNRYPAAPGHDLSGVSYFAGADWNPTRHTHLSAQLGHRYFGPTANFSLTESTAHTSLSVSYSRDQTTSSATGLGLTRNPQYALVDQLFLTAIPDPILRAQAVTNVLQRAGLPTSQFDTIGFLSNQLYLQKRFEASLALLGLRNTVTLTAYRSESQVLSSLSTGFDVFDQASKFRQTGFSANWSYKLGPRTSANVGAQKVHNTAISGTGDTRQRILSASVNRQIAKNLSGILLYRNSRQDSASGAVGGSFSGNYRENAVIGSLHLNF